ncbi:MAG: hypothetical protein LBI69_00710 [Puniceicoccales bacterium]|jgi:hypothetical protein|nr:hypothetical protein [Puniceicoccales bacterium]
MNGENAYKCFAYAAQSNPLIPSIPGENAAKTAIEVTATLQSKKNIFNVRLGMKYYLIPNEASVDLKKVAIDEHLATIMVNFCCNSIVAFLLWLFCGYFRTPSGYDRMLNAASTEKQIHDCISEIINGEIASENLPDQNLPNVTSNPQHVIPNSPQSNLDSPQANQANSNQIFNSISMNPNLFHPIQNQQNLASFQSNPTFAHQQNISQSSQTNLFFPQLTPNETSNRDITQHKIAKYPGEHRQTSGGKRITISIAQTTDYNEHVTITGGLSALSHNEIGNFQCSTFNRNPDVAHLITTEDILAMIGTSQSINSTKTISTYKLNDYGVIPITRGSIFSTNIHFTRDRNGRQAYASYDAKDNMTGKIIGAPLGPGMYLIPCQNNLYVKFQVNKHGKVMDLTQIPFLSSSIKQIKPQNTTHKTLLRLKPIFYNGGSLEIDHNANEVICAVNNGIITTGKKHELPVHPGHYIVMSDHKPIAAYVTVGNNGQILFTENAVPLEEKDFLAEYRRINPIRISSMRANTDVLTGWPVFLRNNLDIELKNIPSNISNESPLLNAENFRNVPDGGNCKPLKAISVSAAENEFSYCNIIIKRINNQIIAFNSSNYARMPQGIYLLPLWNDGDHKTYTFTKLQIGDCGVVANGIPESSVTLQTLDQINKMPQPEKKDLLDMARSNCVIGHLILPSGDGRNFNIVDKPIYIYFSRDTSDNVSAYCDSNKTTLLPDGMYSIPLYNGINYKITIDNGIPPRQSSMNPVPLAVNPNMQSQPHPNMPNLVPPPINLNNAPAQPPQPLSEFAFIKEIRKSLTPENCISVNVFRIADGSMQQESDAISAKFQININGNVFALDASNGDYPLPQGRYLINFNKTNHQIVIGENGFLKETHALLRKKEFPYTILPSNNGSFVHIAKVSDDGKYDSNNKIYLQVNNASISAEPGIYVVLDGDGQAIGNWLNVGMNGQLLPAANSISLLPFDPLAQSSNSPQQPTFIECADAQINSNSFALLADSSHFQNMPLNTTTWNITAFPPSPDNIPMQIYFSRTNNGNITVCTSSGNQFLPPGIYNIPQRDQNFHIQIEVGTNGSLVPIGLRENFKNLYPNGHRLPLAGVRNFDITSHTSPDPIWICAIEGGKYTDRWYLVKPSRDGANNLEFSCINENAGNPSFSKGEYIYPTNNGLCKIEINIFGCAISNVAINLDITPRLNAGILGNENYVSCNGIIYLAKIQNHNGTSFYNSNDILACNVATAINFTPTIEFGNSITVGDNFYGQIPQNGIYVVLSPKNRNQILGWINIFQEKIATPP